MDENKVNREREGVDVTSVINYKNHFMVNGQLVTFSLALVEGVAYNNRLSWPFLNTIKA